MGHMGNGVQGYGAHVWAMRYRGMGHMGNGAQGQWGTGVWDTWEIGYRGMGHIGNGYRGTGCRGIGHMYGK